MRAIAAISILLLVAGSSMWAQPVGTWATNPIGEKVADPIPNRLFIMPTGTIIEPNRLRVGTLGLLGIQGTYAPSRYMQVNVGGLYSPFPAFYSYATSGVKLQVFEPDDWFGGLAVGADFGLLYGRGAESYRGSLLSYNVATSFGLGIGDAMLHLNATSLPYGTTDTATLKLRYALQVGMSVPVYVTGDRGYKAIAEFTGGGTGMRDMHAVFAAIGVRGYTRRMAWEAGVAMGPRGFGEHAEAGTMFYKLPYVSITLIP